MPEHFLAVGLHWLLQQFHHWEFPVGSLMWEGSRGPGLAAKMRHVRNSKYTKKEPVLVLKVVCFVSPSWWKWWGEKKVEAAQSRWREIRIKMKCDRGDRRERKNKRWGEDGNRNWQQRAVWDHKWASWKALTGLEPLSYRIIPQNSAPQKPLRATQAALDLSPSTASCLS